MALTCTLGSAALASYLVDAQDLGAPVLDYDVVAGTHADLGRLANVRTNAPVQTRLRLKVSAATTDLLIAALKTIRDECRKTTNTLTVQPDGATSSVTFNVLESPHLSVPWDNLFELKHVAVFDITLTREPWAYGSAVTAISAVNVTLPDGLSFKAAAGDATTILGDVDTPLTITLVPNSDADMQQVFIGWYATADWTAYLVETDTSGSWVGGTAGDAALSSEHDSSSVKNTGTVYSYLPIDTAAYTAGSYLIIARVCLEDAADTGTFKLSTSAGDITDEVTLDPDSTEWRLIELGVVHLPVQDTVSGTAANLRVNMKCSSAKFVAMDYVGFVPIDYGLCRYHPAVETTDASALKFMLGKTYVENVVSYSGAGGHGVKCHGNGTLVVFAEHDNANAATYAGTITVSYTPRFESWR